MVREWLKELRINKGLTQEKTFAYWETSQKRKDIADLYRIANKFKSLAEL